MMQSSRFLTVAALVLAPSLAAAQGNVPLAKAVVSDAVAQRTLVKYQINSQLARQLVNACVEFAATQPNNLIRMTFSIRINCVP